MKVINVLSDVTETLNKDQSAIENQLVRGSITEVDTAQLEAQMVYISRIRELVAVLRDGQGFGAVIIPSSPPAQGPGEAPGSGITMEV